MQFIATFSDGIISETRQIYLFIYLFLNFLNLDSILNIFQKKVTLIVNVFLNLQTPKNSVREMYKKSPF